MNIQPATLNTWSGNVNQLKPEKTQPDAKSAEPQQAKSAQETAADAAEEVASLHEHRNEARDKFSGRHLGKSHANQHRAIQHIAQLQHLYQLLHSPIPRQQREKLQQVKNRLQQASGQHDDAMQAVLELSDGDPVVADTLLQLVASEKLLNDTAAEDPGIAQAETVREQLNQQHGERIAAGRNTAAAIAQFTQNAEMKQLMRQLYYGSIIDYQSPGHVFDTLMEKFGGDNFNQALHTLQRALADDIGALSPSMSRLALRNVLHGLKLLGNVQSVLSDSHNLVNAIHQRSPHSVISRDQLARKLIHLTQNGIYANEINQLMQQAVGHETKLQSWFLNALLRLMNSLPLTLWRDDKSQQDGLNLMRSLTSQYTHWEKQQLISGAR